MSAEPVWRLNLELFQLQQTPYGLECLDGLAIRETRDGQFFVDPQQEPGNPMNYGPAAESNLALGVDEDLALIAGDARLRHASLPLEDDSPDYNLSLPIGSEKLGVYDPEPLGRAALVGLAEHGDLTLLQVNPGNYQQTRLLHESPAVKNGQPMLYAAKLVLLGSAGSMDVAYDLDGVMRVARVTYDYNSYGLRIDDRGSDGGEEGTGGDPEPRQPIDPLDTDSIALEPPVDMGSEDTPTEPVLLLV